MRCILYELVFQKKAFNDDMTVLSYCLSKNSLEIPSEFDLDSSRGKLFLEKAISKDKLQIIIYDILNLESSKRSAAQDFCDLFSIINDLSFDESGAEHVRSNRPLFTSDLKGLCEDSPGLNSQDINPSIPDLSNEGE